MPKSFRDAQKALGGVQRELKKKRTYDFPGPPVLTVAVDKKELERLVNVFRKFSPQEIIDKLVVDINETLSEAIRSRIWEYNGGLEDIVDSGQLLRSQSVSIDGDSINISYSAPYAALIHYGGYIQPYGNENTERAYIPPRPWVDETLEGSTGILDLDAEISRLAVESLSKLI